MHPLRSQALGSMSPSFRNGVCFRRVYFAELISYPGLVIISQWQAGSSTPEHMIVDFSVSLQSEWPPARYTVILLDTDSI
jgi:hypothetical protein